MPATANEQPQATAHAFIGLQSYTEAQTDSFFGRDEEIEALTGLVKSNTLTIVFGKSGTGKTSLLNAGVFPKLRKEFCLPFRIRLEFKEESPDLITQIKKVLKQEIDKYGFKAESYPASETLWEYFHKEPLWKTVTPILIFDQFEELFTLAKKNPRFGNTELAVFWEELSDLIENSIPEKLKVRFLDHKEQIQYNYKKQKSKIVFAFREEFLPEFESITLRIPSIKFSRFRLMPMNGHQAYEVITKTWKENINPSEAKQIVSYLTNETDQESYDLITVEPSLLSQVCAYIDKERIEEGANKVSAELLNKYPKETILRSIYNEAVIAADNALNIVTESKEKEQRNHVKEFLEEKLITTEGFRTKYTLSEKDDNIRPGIEVLKNKYFIREDDKSVELTHDVLAPLIKADREKRRKEIALTAERKKARKKALIILLVTLLAAGGFWALAAIQSNKAINQLKDARDSLVVINRLIKEGDSILKSESGPSSKNKSVKPVPYDSSALKQNIKNYDSLIHLNEVTIKKLRGEIIILNDTIIVYKDRLRGALPTGLITSLSGQIRDLRNNLSASEKKVEELISENKVLNEENLKLRKELETLRKELMKKQITIDSLLRALGNVTLKGKIYYDQDGPDKPSNLSLYLIPQNENRKIIRNASVYEIFCNEKELDGVKGIKKTVTDINGYYAFRNVPKGEYLLKICGYYGGFYKISIGNVKPLEKDFNASFPVKYPYTIEQTP